MNQSVEGKSIGRCNRRLIICGGTDSGVYRGENQDTFVIADLATGKTSRPCVRTDVSVRRPGVLLVVCDGIGGRPAGDVAAHVAARAVKHELEEAGRAVLAEPASTLEEALKGASHAVRREADAHPEEKGMGTTCTAAVFGPQHLAVAQVGDSRAYLLREGTLRRLTRDQTLATELLDEGVLRPEDVEGHPYHHILAQALGSEGRVEPVVTEIELREGDRVLLCSDGLHGPVHDDAIASILTSTRDVEDTAKALIAAALAEGGPDNVTVVVAECGPLAVV